MPLTVEEFQSRLVRSGILDAETLDTARRCLNAADPGADAEPWGRELVNLKILSRFQAASLLQPRVPALVLHNYILEERLWAGRMAEVFKARHRHLQRTVAIKVLSASLMHSPEDVERFHREVEVAGKLEHPNVITAYDANEYNGVPFLVMQHVAGVDLDVLVRLSGPLSIEDAVQCILQAARGLAHTHDCGVVHRDIKPGNMILGTDGVLRILDLGLAGFASPPNDFVAEKKTVAPVVPMGTPGFHAPEQARLNAAPDPRSDLCSLGYTLYYLLIGTTVDDETKADRTSATGLRAQPSLRRLRPDVPESLDALFQKTTAYSPDNRYQSANALIEDLLKCSIPFDYHSPNLCQAVSNILEAQETFRSPGRIEPLTSADSTWEALGSSHPTAPLPEIPDAKQA